MGNSGASSIYAAALSHLLLSKEHMCINLWIIFAKLYLIQYSAGILPRDVERSGSCETDQLDKYRHRCFRAPGSTHLHYLPRLQQVQQQATVTGVEFDGLELAVAYVWLRFLRTGRVA